MSERSAKIFEILQSCRGGDWPANYAGYFKCFNEGLFFEAHDVLEEIWLKQRGGPKDDFYKGLIQFAGGFVHLQKSRMKPAVALFRLSQKYLGAYPPTYDGLNVRIVLEAASDWISAIERTNYEANPFPAKAIPRLELRESPSLP